MGKKMVKRQTRDSLSDFDRFKVMVLKKKVRNLFLFKQRNNLIAKIAKK